MSEGQPAAVPAGSKSKRSARLPFLDWTRGLAALIMLQGHVFHSFMRADLRDSGPYVISQFIGGLTPAVFLFLTGITLAFLMHGLERKEVSPPQRVMASLRRAGYLLALALAFRLQLWLFGLPYSSPSDLLKVDILNCMAFAIAACAAMAFGTVAQRVHGGIALGCGIAALSPLVSIWDASGLPYAVRIYLTPDANFFAFFPWASFVAFGVGAGSILRLTPSEHMHRLMQWTSLIGFGLIITAQYFSSLPYSLYPKVDFWLNSPGLIFIKLGVILVILALAFLWTHHGTGDGWSPVRQLGVTSLLVYWVHIELVYGRWFGWAKEKLSVEQCALFSIVLIGLMLLLSLAQTHAGWGEVRRGFSKLLRPAQRKSESTTAANFGMER